MGCPDRSCDGQEAHRTDKAFLKRAKQISTAHYRAEYGIPTA